jgi:hypothetical protein
LRSVFTVIAESVAFTCRVSRRIVSSKPACVTRRKAIATRASLRAYHLTQGEDAGLAASIKEAETAIDYHTVENRTKRKTMQERRNKLAEDMKLSEKTCSAPCNPRTDSSKRRNLSIGYYSALGALSWSGSLLPRLRSTPSFFRHRFSMHEPKNTPAI